jgi:hypothetical protein
MTTPKPAACPRCGAAASGNFCSACGGSLAPRLCAGCRAELSPQARFCHRCGHPAAEGARRASSADRKAWLLAVTLCVLLVGLIAYKVRTSAPQPVAPDMANTGAAGGLPQGPAPDISRMTPRERFDRLFNRIMQATERRDSGEVVRFTPMALGAYSQLDAVDVDARYHAAVLHLQVGAFPAAKALADTILTESPSHLFGYVIRGMSARLQNDRRALAEAQRAFLANYESAMRSNQVEYLEHKPGLDEFRQEAERAEKAVEAE